MEKKRITYFVGKTTLETIKGERTEKKFVVAEGNLTKAPQIEEVKGYKIVKNVSLGCAQNLDKQWDLLNGCYSKDKNYGENNGFINLKFWGKQAEAIEKLGQKGLHVLVHGSMEKSEYESNGEKKCSYWLNVEGFKVLTFKNNENSTPEQSEGFTPDNDFTPDNEFSGDDIPF